MEILRFVTGSLAALALTSNGIGQCYEIIELESIGGICMANDINDAGWAVGEAQDGEGLRHAVLWIDGSPTDLGTLGGNEAVATSLNNLGQIVGFSFNTDGNPRAFMREEGKMIDLGTLGGLTSFANGINDNTQIVGYSKPPAGGCDNSDHAFIWQDGVMTDLGKLIKCAGGDTIAWGINASGNAVGKSRDVSQRGVLWISGEIIDLGTLGTDTVAFGINSANQVVGQSKTGVNELNHAFVWENDVITDLGTIDGSPSSSSIARDINNKSIVVGESGCAVMWENGFITCLAELLPQNTEWQALQTARAINTSGQIAGRGTINEEIRGYVLTQISECQCDFNCDGTVNTGDLLVLLGSWGSCFNCDNCPADLDGDCQVNTVDLLFLLANWG